MSRQFKDLIIFLIRPPLIVLGFVAKNIYTLFFGRADKRLAQQQQDRFASEIQQDLSFLFQEYGAKIVPNSGLRFPPGFDYAVVTLDVGDLFFRFIRGRGDLDVQVTSKQAPNEWHDLSLVVGAMDNPDAMQRSSFATLSDTTPILKSNMPQIQEAFSNARYPSIQQHLTKFKQYESVVTKQLQTEINRRLYS